MTPERARPEDLPAILAIERASHPQPWTESGLREEIERPADRGEMWVLRENTRAVAYLVIWFIVDEAQIQNVTSDPAARRKGYARTLVAHAIDRARAKHCTRLTLEVRATNAAALALYESTGFTRVGERPRYYTNGDTALLMERMVSASSAASSPSS
ncbi:MAG: ribosomal protein S18-alanine N-acetyltransferase [Deltaproteobacteria bacterium]|nr:ribosomal protein S18-alanine N-acetyltransferase [Deltaproteobacteria bacterium]